MPALILPPRYVRGPSFGTPVNRANAIGQSIIGLVRAGDCACEYAEGRRITASGSINTQPQGRGRNAATAAGVYTNRREWFDWEPTTKPFSFIAYWMLTATASGTRTIAGNTSGSSGYLISAVFGTNRRYAAGGVTFDAGVAWPLSTPVLSVLTYDGSTVSAYMNGTSDGSLGGGGAVTYDGFCRVTFGNNPDLTTFDGAAVVWWFALANRVLSAAEARTLANHPWMLFAQPRATAYAIAAAAPSGTWKTTNGLASSSIKTVNGLAKASIKTNMGLTP